VIRRLSVLVALGAFVTPAAASPAVTPSLRLVAREPLVVHGMRFRAHERVRLVAGGQLLWRRADAAGSFSASLSGDPCTASVVRAIGVSGDRAELRLRPQPLCPPG
jgi:hypothetical protein